jgi:hypothetical protein
MTHQLFDLPRQQPLSAAGLVLPGAKISFYLTGTSTPTPVYTTSALSVAHSQPVVADAGGRFAAIYLDPTISYKATVTDANDVLLYTVDPVNDDVGVTALSTNLASTTSGSDGARLVGLRDTTTGSAGLTVSAYLNLKVKGLKATFGAVGDGVTNDATAINTAFTSGKIVEIEEGTYLHNTNLSVPQCVGIVGQGVDTSSASGSILKPGASVTKVLSIGHANAPRFLRDFMIDGVNTTGAVGLSLGDATGWAGDVRQVWVRRFTGGTAYGIQIKDVLKTNLSLITARENRVGIVVDAATAVFPTTMTITNAVSSNNVEQGVIIRNGSGVAWVTLLSESNGKEGVLLLPATNGIIEHEFYNLWMEDNWTDDAGAPATRETKFQFVAGDGTALGTARILATLVSPQFRCSASNPRGALFDGSAVGGIVINPKFTSPLGGDIAWRNSAYGHFGETIAAYDVSSVLEDTGNLVGNNEGQAKAFSPSYESNVGNAATTFTGPGTVTTTTCRFRRMGKRTWLTVNASFTLNAVTPTEIYMTLPSGITISYDQYFDAKLIIGGTHQKGTCIVANTNDRLIFQKADASSFTSGAACTIATTILFENA